MSAQKTKFDALLKSREVNENEALQEELRVRSILDERRVVYDNFVSRKEGLVEQIAYLRSRARIDALRKGDVNGLSTVIHFLRALEKQLAELDKSVVKKKVELDVAKNRAMLAGNDVVLARIERKKVETLVEGRVQSQRVLEAARDEATVDDFNISKYSGHHNK